METPSLWHATIYNIGIPDKDTKIYNIGIPDKDTKTYNIEMRKTTLAAFPTFNGWRPD